MSVDCPVCLENNSSKYQLSFITYMARTLQPRREENILQTPAPVVSAATVHTVFGPTDLTSTYSVCTRREFGGNGHRTQAFRYGVRCSNH
ncbi:hypothetical protein TNCV_2069311 [Trichonephila clavipes]|uniref:Uncharacterized protein n=1 Tax=Trichonephila clavipes TaxID=2585209 RepID=A0A8X6W3V8_TRICX|nr:hypothetical protein TNCV_2069311 [Trichonephila clavipes]